MHVQIPQSELDNAANVVSSLVERSVGPSPILSNLLIEATEQGVQFRGTDQESMVTVNVAAAVKQPGRTTIPADKFRDIVRFLPVNGEVTLEESGNKVLINCETNEYKLLTMPPDDFPQWPPATATTKFQIAQKTLKSLIDGSSYALPTKDHRRVLLGVYFELYDHTLRLTATDGKKLARIFSGVPEVEGKEEAAIIVPRKVLDNVSKTLGAEGPVEIEICAEEGAPTRQIVFRFGNVIYRCNGIEGKYPDCDSVIPKEFPTQIPFNRDLLLQAAKRAGVTTDDKNKSIILKFEQNACQFHSMAHDLGTFSGKISLDYDGPSMEMAFNFQFLIDTLSRFNQPEVKMMIKAPTAPIVFKAQEDDNRLALLMPIKLADIRPGPVLDNDDYEED